MFFASEETGLLLESKLTERLRGKTVAPSLSPEIIAWQNPGSGI
jgi:hypothetical protein